MSFRAPVAATPPDRTILARDLGERIPPSLQGS